MNALSDRVKELDKNLEESERFIKTATSTLAEAVEIQIEESKNSSDNDADNPLSAFDQHVAFLEGQLKEAKVLASQSFQILEDCDREQEYITKRDVNLENVIHRIPENLDNETRRDGDVEVIENLENTANNNVAVSSRDEFSNTDNVVKEMENANSLAHV